MTTPFDEVIEAIKASGYHNHRLEGHSDIVSKGILRDLIVKCPLIANDYREEKIKSWFNVPAPGITRRRRIDLFVGTPTADGYPDVSGIRVGVENKSVVTAHRNKTNRLDDLEDVIGAVNHTKPEAIMVATVLVGTAGQYLNIPDHVKKYYKRDPSRFENEVRPRLSTGDATLWSSFDFAISENRSDDPRSSVQAFRSLTTRRAGQTHIVGYDFVMIVPVFIDNVNPPFLCRENDFGIDVDADYERMLSTICRAYEARWHL